MRSFLIASAIMAVVPMAFAASYQYSTTTYPNGASGGAEALTTYPGSYTLAQCETACSNDDSCTTFVSDPAGPCTSIIGSDQTYVLNAGSTVGNKGDLLTASQGMRKRQRRNGKTSN